MIVEGLPFEGAGDEFDAKDVEGLSEIITVIVLGSSRVRKGLLEAGVEGEGTPIASFKLLKSIPNSPAV